VEDLVVDEADIQTAFDDVFDQAIVFHGFADYMRDYDVLRRESARTMRRSARMCRDSGG
jgi:hypothetical protein